MTGIAALLDQFNEGLLNAGCGITIVNKPSVGSMDISGAPTVQHYPNPFTSVTTIRYSLPVDAFVNLVVYNQLGQKVAIQVSNKQVAGSHQASFKAANHSAGIFLYQLQTMDANGKTSIVTGKMVKTK